MTEPDAHRAADPPPAALEPPAEDIVPPQPLPDPVPHATSDTFSQAPLVRPVRGALPWLCALGFLVLAGAIGFVWWSVQQPPSPPPSQAAADLQPLEARVARLEQRPAPPTPAPSLDLAPLTARVAALEQRAAPDPAPLEARIAAVEKTVIDNSPFAARLDALSGRVDALSGRQQGAESGVSRRLDIDEGRLATLEHAVTQMAATAQQAARLARIQVAQAALAAGQPLGDLPDAPSAVARFATANPPTEASLRLAYPQAERAALSASHADSGEDTFLARVLGHAEDLVTVRQGDRVLVGDPAAGMLARARAALNASDLAGAVAAVSSLSGPPATAMAAWLADAKALLHARAGLSDMAAHA